MVSTVVVLERARGGEGSGGEAITGAGVAAAAFVEIGTTGMAGCCRRCCERVLNTLLLGTADAALESEDVFTDEVEGCGEDGTASSASLSCCGCGGDNTSGAGWGGGGEKPTCGEAGG